MRRFLPRIAGDRAGTAAIELALAAPILAVMIMGVTDVSNAFSRKLSLEQGAQRAIEKVMQTTALKEVQDTIAEEVSLQADVDEDQVTVEFPRYCNDVKMTDTVIDGEGYSTGEPCTGTARQSHYILVTVTDNYKPLFSTLSLGTKQADGSYKIVVQAGMRTQ